MRHKAVFWYRSIFILLNIFAFLCLGGLAIEIATYYRNYEEFTLLLPAITEVSLHLGVLFSLFILAPGIFLGGVIMKKVKDATFLHLLILYLFIEVGVLVVLFVGYHFPFLFF